MTAPSLTNPSIANTEKSDITKLTANDNDLLNAMIDGTKDLTFGSIDLNVSPGVLTDLLPTDATYNLGSTTYGWKAIYLENAATDGGAVFFDGSNASFLKSDTDGTGLKIGGFDELTPNAATTTDLGNATTPFKYLYLNSDVTDGGGVIFDGGTITSKYLKCNAGGTVLSTDLLINAPNGTVGAPSISFINEPDCGMYYIGANNIGIGVNGAKVLDIGTAGLGITGDIYTTVLTDVSNNITGFSSTTTAQASYKKIGKQITLYFRIAGTSNATTFTITGLPQSNTTVDALSITRTKDNSGSYVAGLAYLAVNGTTVSFYADLAASAYTASGTKEAWGELTYETAS